ncbi:double zinc ribbon domain-containing protein [Paenibacillus sp. N3.4]|uniref:double zinc ribbon domain-containing protein n=1 Tax=Paenibacillus sp. N3.4 TaxID=2603222 RepID=UPI0028FCDF7A|nr:zinc ribbon domain-containing protein [Paenibacillus sp. N3.4]
MEERIKPIFQEYGLILVNFTVDSINIPENDPATARLKEALAKKAEMDIIGYTYGQERTFDTLEGAAKNQGRPSMYAEAGLGFGMGQVVGSSLGSLFSNNLSGTPGNPAQHVNCNKCGATNVQGAKFCMGCGASLQVTVPPAPETVACSGCSQPIPVSAKFCPHCGDAYRPCPSCKADNKEEALHCTQCGTNFQLTCGQCKQTVQPGQKFCFECGHSLA